MAFRSRQMIGKYRIERRLGEGGFAVVYQAMDTIEGVRVALKVPHAGNLNDAVLRDFRNEARMTAKLDHPNILPLKDASIIDGHFIIAFHLGEKTLSERLRKRMAFETAMQFAEQMLAAVAHAHGLKIVHCDITPDNLLIFPDKQLRLADFGIAKVAQRTIKGSGSGTVGFMAPEQAMGRPSPKSDVFSLGLVIYRMLAGQRPEWPYEWPPVGHKKLRRLAHPDLVDFLRRAIEPVPRKRFRDGVQMLNVFRRVKKRSLKYAAERRRR